MTDPSPSTLTVLNSNFLQLGRRSGGRPQPTVYPSWLPVNCERSMSIACGKQKLPRKQETDSNWRSTSTMLNQQSWLT